MFCTKRNLHQPQKQPKQLVWMMRLILGEISLTLGDWKCSPVPTLTVGTIWHHSRKLMCLFPGQGRKKHLITYISFQAVCQHTLMWLWSVHWEEMPPAVLHLSCKLLKLLTALTVPKISGTTSINHVFSCAFTVEVISHQERQLRSVSLVPVSLPSFQSIQNIIIKPNDLILLPI